MSTFQSRCWNCVANSIHKDVVEVLSRSNKSANTVVLRMAKKDWRIEGTSDVIPVSFLEDTIQHHSTSHSDTNSGQY